MAEIRGLSAWPRCLLEPDLDFVGELLAIAFVLELAFGAVAALARRGEAELERPRELEELREVLDGDEPEAAAVAFPLREFFAPADGFDLAFELLAAPLLEERPEPDLRRRRRWTLLIASINSSFLIACQPGTP